MEFDAENYNGREFIGGWKIARSVDTVDRPRLLCFDTLFRSALMVLNRIDASRRYIFKMPAVLSQCPASVQLAVRTHVTPCLLASAAVEVDLGATGIAGRPGPTASSSSRSKAQRWGCHNHTAGTKVNIMAGVPAGLSGGKGGAMGLGLARVRYSQSSLSEPRTRRTSDFSPFNLRR